MLALKAVEGLEGPDRRAEDRTEERVLGGEIGVGLARTEEGVAMEPRVRTTAVGATAVDVVTLDVWRELCWEGRESGSWLLTGLYGHLSSCRLTLSDRLSPLRLLKMRVMKHRRQ